MYLQRTLKSTIRATGVGLHSGEKVTLVLKPAPENSGIVFHRVDLPESAPFRVEPSLVNDTRLSSTLVKDGVRVGTIEHLMVMPINPAEVAFSKVLATMIVVLAAGVSVAPAWLGRLAPVGSHEELPDHWPQAAAWPAWCPNLRPAPRPAASPSCVPWARLKRPTWC